MSVYKMPFKTDRRTDVQYMGEEPILKGDVTPSQFGNALNWYNYFYSTDASKFFTINYLVENNYDEKVISKVKNAKEYNFTSIGWMFRILSNGGTLPANENKRAFEKLDAIINKKEEIDEVVTDFAVPPKTKKKSNFVSVFEDELDSFYKSGYKLAAFDPLAFMKKNNITKDGAKEVISFYEPLFNEIVAAAATKEKEGYENLTTVQFKNYITFLNRIISDAKLFLDEKKIVRKPRVKKAKSPDKLVSKLNFKTEDNDFKIKSVAPVTVLGAEQVWVFNTKYRILTKYTASNDNGLGVKGSTLLNFSTATSVSYKIRKPDEVLPNVLNSGKIGLRSIFDKLTTTPMEPTGRINSDTVILRTVKK